MDLVPVRSFWKRFLEETRQKLIEKYDKETIENIEEINDSFFVVMEANNLGYLTPVHLKYVHNLDEKIKEKKEPKEEKPVEKKESVDENKEKMKKSGEDLAGIFKNA